MIAQSAASDLVRRLQTSWPDWLPPLLPSEDPLPVESHPLSGEIEGLLQGKAASLPFFPAGSADIAWITLTPDGESLRAAYRDLRAWLLPSVGWEDPRGAFVPKGSSGNPLLETLSPSGYLRWRTRREPAVLHSIVTRLRTARELAEARPARLVERVPSLLELRQRFSVALVAGDRPAAEHAIETIDSHRLDTASNASFLRVRLWDHFGDPSRIVEIPELEHLVHVRLPQRVRVAICRAFHTTRLSGPEQIANLNEICRLYSDELDPLIGQIVERCGPEDGPELRRLRGYRAWKKGNPEVSRAILAEAEDALLQAEEQALAKPVPLLQMSDGELALIALLSLICAPDDLGGTLFFVEEPENHLHPRLLETLVALLRQVQAEVSGRSIPSQVLLTTHSPYLADQMNLDEILWVERRSGETAVVRPSDNAHLRRLVEDRDLGIGDLMLTGTLGE